LRVYLVLDPRGKTLQIRAVCEKCAAMLYLSAGPPFPLAAAQIIVPEHKCETLEVVAIGEIP
jgi:hypothetical protein